MYKLTVFLVLLTIVLQNISEADTYGIRNGGSSGGGGSYGSGGVSSRSSYSYVGKRNSYFMNGGGRNQDEQQQNIENNGPQNLDDYGISLVSLILIMIAVIVAGFTLYYSVICYPFLCKSEKTYQFVEVSSTITGATSRSIQSIENFQTDHKH